MPLQGLALPVEVWERDVLPRRVGAYSQSWMDSLCASGELVWVGAGASGRSGRVALYFREDAGVIGPPNHPARGGQGRARAPDGVEHELLRACLAHGPSFFTDLLTACAREGELASSPGGDAPAEALREALWDLVWAGEVTNDAWAPLRAPRLSLARSQPGAAWGRLTLTGTGGDGRSPRIGRATIGRSPGGTRPRFAGRRRGGTEQVQGRWSLTAPVFHGGGNEMPTHPAERRRTLAELLLERYGIVTREQVLAEGIAGGFASLYDTFCNLETLGICRRGYFIEGMGGAQFALPGAVERLRAAPGAGGAVPPAPGSPLRDGGDDARTFVLAAADPAQPYGAALPWPRRASAGREPGGGRPARVAGAYVVLVDDQPVLFVERGGRGLVTLAGAPAGAGEADPLHRALAALARAVRAGRVGKLALERIDGRPAIGSELADLLVELGFHAGPRRFTLSA